MIKQLDQYIGRAALLGTLGVWLALTMLMTLFNLLDELEPGEGGFHIGEVLWYVMLSIPRASYMVFPVSALLGSLIGVGGLAAANELVAFRTSGVSRLRISGSVLGAVLLLTLGVMAMGEWVAPPADAQARNYKLQQAVGRGAASGDVGMWLRDGNEFAFIQKPIVGGTPGENDLRFHNVVIYGFNDDGDLRSMSRAMSARHRDGRWLLEDVTDLDISPAGVERQTWDQRIWHTGFLPELLESAVVRPRYMSARDLSDQITYLGRNGLDDRVYRSALWSKLLFPVTVLALVLAGMPFVFGHGRQQSMGLRIFIGMAMGSLFMIVSRAAQNFADAYGLPVMVGALAPSLLLTVAVVLALRRSV
ncbi:LPS export ABC transporter permease LptG [Marinihelvus fidelis]|uniref:LPS export ABC transporter permease LptG n=1 Tax=Marinihelvus fidelis TaxID=2613842 RepID=A0A5N0T9H4_9GAMM|nr:LPS export ABC transporter permease LptG [Marinihelvus fidelis]KAA9130787.1 LPS export ABC transporter permease LptG [Marinihelvus fidelis]